jgi:hypothetical protein
MCVSRIGEEVLAQPVIAEGQAELSIEAGAVTDQAIGKWKIVPAQWTYLIHICTLSETGRSSLYDPVTAHISAPKGSQHLGAVDGRNFLFIVAHDPQPATRHYSIFPQHFPGSIMASARYSELGTRYFSLPSPDCALSHNPDYNRCHETDHGYRPGY